MSSLGPYLRGLREAKGMSLDDIARSTRVGRRHLEALESDTFGELPAPVFVKGFIRAYCEFLECLPEKALDLYRETTGEPASSHGPMRPLVAPRSRRAGPLAISIVLFVVLDFFWGLIVFLLTLLLGGTSGSAVAVEATLVSYYANPAQFLQLINVYVFQSSSGFALQSSNYGVTLPAIILDGLLWAIVPFLAFMYLAVKRD